MNWELILRLLLAGVLGTIIGLDREYRAKEAGFRTHFLVSLGSALFMVISQYGFADALENQAFSNATHLDPSRVAAQIVSGIGFLGAGTIIFQKQFVRGLTTAAGLWATAGIGMAIGGGLYWIGISATVLTLAGLELLTIVFKNVGLSSMSFLFSTTDKRNLVKVVDEISRKKCKLISYNTTEDTVNGISTYKTSIIVKIHVYNDEKTIFSFIQSLPDTTLISME